MQSVSRWYSAYRDRGKSYGALKNWVHTGRPSKLNKRQLMSIPKILAKGAQHYGFFTDLWTAERLGKVIEEKYGIQYSLSQVARILNSLNLSYQKPEGKAREYDEKKVRDWVRNILPDIKKTEETDGVLVIEEESGVSLIPLMGRTWAPRGQTPVIEHNFNLERLSAIGGITLQGKLYFRVHAGSIRKEQVIEYLQQLLRHIRRHIVLLWDGSASHRARGNRLSGAEQTQDNRIPTPALLFKVQPGRVPLVPPEIVKDVGLLSQAATGAAKRSSMSA